MQFRSEKVVLCPAESSTLYGSLCASERCQRSGEEGVEECTPLLKIHEQGTNLKRQNAE